MTEEWKPELTQRRSPGGSCILCKYVNKVGFCGRNNFLLENFIHVPIGNLGLMVDKSRQPLHCICEVGVVVATGVAPCDSIIPTGLQTRLQSIALARGIHSWYMLDPGGAPQIFGPCIPNMKRDSL